MRTRLRIWLPIKQSKEGTKLLSLVVIDSIEINYSTLSNEVIIWLTININE